MAQYGIYRPVGGWGAFDELRREMDALLGRFGGGIPSGRTGVFPAANLYETEDAYVLTAELPGVKPGDIDVSIERATITLRGERKIEHPDGGANVHRAERQSGAFRRAFELPVAVDAEKVEAIHRNGVLMLRLPKAPEHQPRQIRVKSA